MGVVDDAVRSIQRRIEDGDERGVKVVPITVVTVSPLTVSIQGSETAYAAVFMSNEGGGVGDTGYGLWWPGLTPLMVFTVNEGWTNLSLTAAGGSGTARVKQMGCLTAVQFNLTGASIATGATPTTVASGVPDALRPASTVAPGIGNAGGNTIATVNMNTDGTVAVSHNFTSAVVVLRSNFVYVNKSI